MRNDNEEYLFSALKIAFFAILVGYVCEGVGGFLMRVAREQPHDEPVASALLVGVGMTLFIVAAVCAGGFYGDGLKAKHGFLSGLGYAAGSLGLYGLIYQPVSNFGLEVGRWISHPGVVLLIFGAIPIVLFLREYEKQRLHSSSFPVDLGEKS